MVMYAQATSAATVPATYPEEDVASGRNRRPHPRDVPHSSADEGRTPLAVDLRADTTTTASPPPRPPPSSVVVIVVVVETTS
jgi:hypothetical protein